MLERECVTPLWAGNLQKGDASGGDQGPLAVSREEERCEEAPHEEGGGGDYRGGGTRGPGGGGDHGGSEFYGAGGAGGLRVPEESAVRVPRERVCMRV